MLGKKRNLKRKKSAKAGKKQGAKGKKKQGKGPLVSVIIPVLNEEEWLEKCINALEKQSIPREKYEIIVTDSESGDSSLKIAKRLADKVKKVKRLGAGHGRNEGAKMARGKYFAFIDADTLVGEKWIEGLLDGMERSVGVTGPFETIEKDSLKVELFFRWWSFQDWLSTKINCPVFPGFNMAVRKKEFFELGGFINMTAEDLDFGLRLKRLGRVSFNKKMFVRTSNRRLKEIPILPYVWNGTSYFLFGKSRSWKEHRKDFSE